jgi:hypothetical protein
MFSALALPDLGLVLTASASPLLRFFAMKIRLAGWLLVFDLASNLQTNTSSTNQDMLLRSFSYGFPFNHPPNVALTMSLGCPVCTSLRTP